MAGYWLSSALVCFGMERDKIEVNGPESKRRQYRSIHLDRTSFHVVLQLNKCEQMNLNLINEGTIGTNL